MYSKRPHDTRSPAPTNDDTCKRCDGPITLQRDLADLNVTLNICACGVTLAYNPGASEIEAACRICDALGDLDAEPYDHGVGARIPHVHLVPSVEEAGLNLLRGVVSHPRYEAVLQTYEEHLEKLGETLQGSASSWGEIQQVALALQNTADGLEVLHAHPTGAGGFS